MVRKVQNLRKESDFQISDRIDVLINCHDVIFDSINFNDTYNDKNANLGFSEELS